METAGFSTSFRAWAVMVLAAALTYGCATYSGSNLVAGKSTAAEVESTMGAPAERMDAAGGEKVWFYPRGPAGRQTFAVRIGPDGVVRGVEQRLTEANIAKLAFGNTTEKDARALLGPPNLVYNYPRIKRSFWEYKMTAGENQTSNLKILALEFSADGILRGSTFQDDVAGFDLGGACLTC